MSGGPSEIWEGLQGLEPAGEYVADRGGGATSVLHVLLISGLDSTPLWGGDLGFVRGNVEEDEGGTRRFLKADNGA